METTTSLFLESCVHQSSSSLFHVILIIVPCSSSSFSTAHHYRCRRDRYAMTSRAPAHLFTTHVTHNTMVITWSRRHVASASVSRRHGRLPVRIDTIDISYSACEIIMSCAIFFLLYIHTEGFISLLVYLHTFIFHWHDRYRNWKWYWNDWGCELSHTSRDTVVLVEYTTLRASHAYYARRAATIYK